MIERLYASVVGNLPGEPEIMIGIIIGLVAVIYHNLYRRVDRIEPVLEQIKTGVEIIKSRCPMCKYDKGE